MTIFEKLAKENFFFFTSTCTMNMTKHKRMIIITVFRTLEVLEENNKVGFVPNKKQSGRHTLFLHVTDQLNFKFLMSNLRNRNGSCLISILNVLKININ